jgi:hypothetical protein
MTRLSEFSIDAVEPGTKGVYSLSLPLGEDLENLAHHISLASSAPSCKKEIRSEISRWLRDEILSLPVLAARGIALGETLVVTSGVHGDEGTAW